MLIGAHVSISGGLDKAIERGSERGCNAIQIFNQSPRMWRPNNFTPDDFATFRTAMQQSPIDAVVIHSIYLINPTTTDPELLEKSVKSLTHALQVGDAIGSAGVVLHPGHQKDKESYEDTLGRIVAVVTRALAESESCPMLLENAGGRRAIGKKFEELADLLELLDDDRVGICVDSCHSLVAGYEVDDAQKLAETVDEFDKIVGLQHLKAIHLNDSKAPLGAFLDRHENLGDGELGREGCAAWLSEPRFEGLPVLMETPGSDKKGPSKEDVAVAFELRQEGLTKR